MESVKHTGSCLCRGVRFEIEGQLAQVQLCHCQQCRKASGTVFASNIPINADKFKLLTGKDLLKAYESSPGKKRVFCLQCGSPIYSERPSNPGNIRIRAGTLDGDVQTTPAFHFYTDSKANWYQITDHLQQFPDAPSQNAK